MKKSLVAILLTIFFLNLAFYICTNSEDSPSAIPSTIQYNIYIFPNASSFNTGNYSAELSIFISLEKIGDNISITSLSFENETLKSYLCIDNDTIEDMIISPSIGHFYVPPYLLNQFSYERSGSYNGWKFNFIDEEPFYISNNEFVDGYRFLLNFGEGSKSIIYDKYTGILLSESFYVEEVNCNSYYFLVDIASFSNPSLINYTQISDENERIFQGISILIICLAGISLYKRKDIMFSV
ncbi:hypothetical protein [Fervidicoccus fontis]|uniref:Uncharacterized protein n=1 Tax=Fervidicoccus fontis TaxID=683846 RepID=A0A7C2ZAW5_9CREN|nr:hypothetical protein [Fervidicoccus fontis]PMB76394.1 MAG: hypothetical protein C0177_06400 [Fervidicoccus fontis]HEW64129.1 hypothetical protein [Fervidicoccus fontis]